MAVMAEMLALANGLTLFASALILLVVAIGALIGPRDERRWPRLVVATLGLLAAASSRDVLWIYIGFQVLALAAASTRAVALLVSAPMVLGLAWVAFASRTSDLAALDASMSVAAGVALFVLGMMTVWVIIRREQTLLIASSVAIVVVLARVHAWAPAIADELAAFAWLVGVVLILMGGVVASLTSTMRSLATGATIFTVGFALIGLGGGAPALPFVLMHVAASSVVTMLVLADASSTARWLLLLSLASVPPLPGFVTKLGLLAGYPPGTLVLALVGSFLVGVGCVRRLGGEAPAHEARWVTPAALAAVVTLGLFPQTLIEVAARAAAAMF